MRFAGVMVLCAVLAGCATEPPASNRGVGFSDPVSFEAERLRREQQLAGSGSTTFAPPQAVATAPLGAPVGAVPQGGAIPASDLAAAGIGAARPVGEPLSALSPAAAGVPATPAAAAADVNNPGLSDEQDFSAVSSRESIESDAQRRAAQAAQRQVIAPTALPDRPADTGPNIVAYALNAPNRKGQEWYSRFMFSGQGRFERNCAGFNTPDEAQREFLRRGGPERDPLGIDPDGDGFACGWDPAPFLLAAGR